MVSDEDMSIIKDDVHQIHALITGMSRCLDPLDLGSAFSLCLITCKFTENLIAFLDERV